ncbi:aldehyde dehydrogenase [Amycolatopsis acidicola]|uniref:Aldehyde dehydrogenase n=1 Tax=Amycolatopsis acidicola TaxID=2596893 RepID=A0A5N0UJR3_9PSEU|nr:aldehyde dehydrogenase [Amycolatopsis acidicola]KAA9149534.1 aldehyde dehydrogenase [Amycolatopsis acidicola]
MTAGLEEIELYIGGGPVPADGGRNYESIDPYTGHAWARVADGSAADVDRAVRSARAALGGPWGAMTAPERGKLLDRLAGLIERDAELLGEWETRDSGKLLREMSGQVRALPEWYRYFGGLADKVQGEVIPTGKPNFLVYTQHEPVGVVAAITPWNSPLLLLTWKLAPALAAGCTVVVKPSDHTPSSTVALARLFTEAGFPPGVVNVVTGWGPETGRALTEHPDVDKIAFTGSNEVGRSVAHAAAERFARVTLELGGKSAQIVFEDADLEAAANGVIAGIFAAAGQTCMAGSRLLVHASVADELVGRVAARAESIVVGDPTDARTEMGPLANERQFAKVLEHFRDARAAGATIVTGGEPIPELGGYFVRPTVLRDLPSDSRALTEEIFGPVLSVVPFETEDEAVRLANGTRFGLAGSVWTRDIHRAHRTASRLRAGSVWINAYRTVAPQVPFGGFGASGIGRESGIGAITDYQETRSVWVELSGETRDPFTLG